MKDMVKISVRVRTRGGGLVAGAVRAYRSIGMGARSYFNINI